MTSNHGNGEFDRIVADVRGRVRAFTQQRFEQAVLRRDGHRCAVCNSELNAHAHHIEFLRAACRRVATSGASSSTRCKVAVACSTRF